MKIYLLGRFEKLDDKARGIAISRILVSLGHECQLDVEELFSTKNPQVRIIENRINRVKQIDAIVVDFADSLDDFSLELGSAKALRRPVIILGRKGVEIPISAQNIANFTIEYSNMRELKEKFSDVLGNVVVKRGPPVLCIDAIIKRKNGKLVLIKRKYPPFQGAYALPGGKVEWGETVEAATIREVKEETGLKIKVRGMLGIYSEPGRDPRGHYISIALLCADVGGKLKAGSDAGEVLEVDKLPKGEYAADHRYILKDAGYK